MKRPQLSDLTLREKIGQTVCVRENLMEKIPNLEEHLKQYPYGCMWAMGNQLNDNENMSEGTNKSGKATGKAYRDKRLMAAAATDDEELIFEQAAATARELRGAVVDALFGLIPFRGICPFRLVPEESL